MAGWLVFALLGAIHTVMRHQTSGADHMMRGAIGVVVLPLLTYGIVSACLGRAGLRSSIRGAIALGAPPSRAALATVLVAMAVAAIACAVIAVVVCAIAHGQGDPPLVYDLPASFGVTFAAGAAYAAYFCAGSAIGRGAMRGAFLAIDWILGAGSGFGALFTPRAHVISLLGGPACFDLSRRASSVVLVLVLLAYLALAVRLGKRAR
jgi:hypothetical protein